MLKSLTYQIIFCIASRWMESSGRVRTWAWNRIIAEYPAEIACKLLRKINS